MALCFCITARDRLDIIAETLPWNLRSTSVHIRFALVDYGSMDGLSDWVQREVWDEIESGRLTFFEVTNTVSWSAPKAKNLAHRVALGNYLFNLDADNFITDEDAELIEISMQKGLPCHQWTGVLGDGTCGRIGIPRETFYSIGGYDEGLLPMGYQDIDLLERAALAHSGHIFTVPLRAPAPVKNDKQASMSSFQLSENEAVEAWTEINNVNIKRGLLRRALEGHQIQGGFATFRGNLNGRPVILDGFGNLREDQPESRTITRRWKIKDSN